MNEIEAECIHGDNICALCYVHVRVFVICKILHTHTRTTVFVVGIYLVFIVFVCLCVSMHLCACLHVRVCVSFVMLVFVRVAMLF